MRYVGYALSQFFLLAWSLLFNSHSTNIVFSISEKQSDLEAADVSKNDINL